MTDPRQQFLDPAWWIVPRGGPSTRRRVRKMVMHALRRSRAWANLREDDSLMGSGFALDSTRQWFRLADQLAHVLRYSR